MLTFGPTTVPGQAHWMLFVGGDGLLGSEIYSDYRKRLVTPGLIAGLESE